MRNPELDTNHFKIAICTAKRYATIFFCAFDETQKKAHIVLVKHRFVEKNEKLMNRHVIFGFIACFGSKIH